MRAPATRVGLAAAFALALMCGTASSKAEDLSADDVHASHHAAASANTTQSKTDHVPPAPPAPPAHATPPMSPDEMLATMAMNDDATYAKLKLDRLERGFEAGNPLAWSLDAWIGRDFDKLRLRSEGEHADGRTERADVEVLWSHAASAFWDTELGVRHDIGHGAGRTWGAFGIQGLAPYWFELGATAYVGDAGRTALRIEADYDLSLTQRLIVQPRFELNAYGKSDRAAGVGSGVSDAEIGVRLRYEIARVFAPYIGVERSARFGRSADFARAEGEDAHETRWLIGLRVWY